MTRAEKVATARQMREGGALLREIADRFGVSTSTVDAWLNDQDGSKARARKARYRGVCEDCGAPTSGTRSGLDHAPRWCKACGVEHGKEIQRRVLAARHAERDRLIEAWWNEGLSRREIADRLGWTFGHVQVEVCRLRERGYSLPYRYALRHPKHPEQVAA